MLYETCCIHLANTFCHVYLKKLNKYLEVTSMFRKKTKFISTFLSVFDKIITTASEKH